MKKFLSLVMALVMVMSLVTISAGAKDFTDNDSITYDEAVAVVSEVGIVDGYTDGKFNPTNTLTRQAAAKIICNLILGPTTAAELHADTAPYKDVAVNNEFAGYIAYCQSRGIISGYADGNFRPGNTLTGYAFMKMLLGALGYDSTLEGYVGSNWSINVAKQALGIGLDDGLELKEGAVFNGIKAVTREEACLYAFNTLQADLVEYGQRLTTNINGTEVTLSSGGAQAKKWANQTQQTRINNIREDEIIQFAEEYFRKLEKKLGDDEFMRPAYTWIYDKEEIGTYVDWTLMTEEYTDEVTGRDLYDLLGGALLDDEDMKLEYYVNGVEPEIGWAVESFVYTSRGWADDGNHNITKSNNTIRRSNQDAVGFTGRGVLTQVFVDRDIREKIIITSIDTWLSEAGADYNEAKESAPIEVWSVENSDPGKTWNVDVADVPEVADVTEDTFYLTQISFKDNADGEIVSLVEPEILEESVVTKFSTKTNHVPSKVTTGGTEYKQAVRGYYDPAALYEYDQTLLTDRNYNVILDQFGNMIGIELNEGEKHYVFITGFDRPMSNLSIKTADAAAIFLDGTMQEIKVNVTDTDKNILAVNPKNGDRVGTEKKAGNEYFLPWQTLTTELNQDGFHALNRWFTYTTNKDGVYTLKPAVNMVVYYSLNGGTYAAPGTTVETLKTDNLYLDDNIMFTGGNDHSAATETVMPYASVTLGATGNTILASGKGANLKTGFPYSGINGERCYGNDDSVYITVETDIVDTLTANTRTITGVTGAYTGAQNVEIELDRTAIDASDSDHHVDEADVYAVYDSNHYIIGAVTTGEANGGNATIAYVTDGVKSERIEDGVYYWEFEAIVDGEVKTLTVKEKYGSVLNVGIGKTGVNNEADTNHKELAKRLADSDPSATPTVSATRNWNAYDGIVELRFDADGYVVSVKAVNEKDIYSYYGEKAPTFYRGGNSLTATTDWNKNQTDRMSDYRAYRIGGVSDVAVGNNTWTYSAQAHHYDSAPEELKLVGRTLYVTADQNDEGLALTSDAKAVVIQRENGKWKTREFSNVSSAVSQVADANDHDAGKQYNGEVMAALNGNGQATWVVFTSYTDLRSGGNSNYKTPLTAINVANPLTDWDTDSNGRDGDVTFDLYGTNAGQRYTINLETWNDYQGRWDVIATATVTGTATNTYGAFHDFGELNHGWRYRLSCGDVHSTIYTSL